MLTSLPKRFHCFRGRLFSIFSDDSVYSYTFLLSCGGGFKSFLGNVKIIIKTLLMHSLIYAKPTGGWRLGKGLAFFYRERIF